MPKAGFVTYAAALACVALVAETPGRWRVAGRAGTPEIVCSAGGQAATDANKGSFKSGSQLAHLEALPSAQGGSRRPNSALPGPFFLTRRA